jgi:hypothetical protein
MAGRKTKTSLGKDKTVQTIFQIDPISDEEAREASLVMAGISIKLDDPVGLGVVLDALGLKGNERRNEHEGY